MAVLTSKEDMKGESMQATIRPADLWRWLQHVAERLVSWLPDTRLGWTGWLLIGLYITMAQVVFLTFAFYPLPEPVMAFLVWLREVTYGLITTNNLMLIMFAGLLFVCLAFTPLSLRDFGLNRHNLLRAPLLLLVFWLAIQLLAVLFTLAQTGELRLHESWVIRSGSAIAGNFLGQLFGNALWEELLYRGIILTQLIVLFRLRLSPLMSLLLALMLSNALFALLHLPNWLIVRPDFLAEYSRLFLLWVVFQDGLFFSFVFLVTRNILVTVVLHTLISTPILVVDPQWGETSVASSAVSLVLVVWAGLWWWQRRRIVGLKTSIRT